MTKLRIPGKSDESLKQLDYRSDRQITVREAVRFEATRDATAEDHVIEDLKDDDVIELTFEDGIRHWATLSEFKQEFGAGISRGASVDEIVVPGRLFVGTATRGGGSWVLKALRVFDFDPAEKTASAIATLYDNKLVRKPGLRRFTSPDTLGAEVGPDDLPTTKSALIFIHGTASTSTGSFGKLRGDVWQDLCDQYGENIYAFEHHTLAVSPIQNALDLARRLPQRANIDLVSHSRGGLVGEFLCRGTRKNGVEPFDDLDRRLLEKHPKEIRQALIELGDELSQKRPAIQRFARVACPAGGTTLASGRLDRWLEVIVNVFGRITGLSENPIYSVLSDFMLDVKKQTLNADAMPGLEAMVPTSPVIRMLNRGDVELDADLSVIAGDIEGAGVLKRIAVFFANLFYLEQHDLVVHTRAMYGGGKRTSDPVFYFDQGPEVDHFHYFANEETADGIRNVLRPAPPQALPSGFRPVTEVLRRKATREITARSYQKRSGLPQPAVFVLPGIMGSHLAVGDDRIWLSPLDLAFGKLVNLNIDAPGVQAQAVIARAYGDLVEYLSATHEVIPFPYDWRISIVDEAKRLGKEIAAKLDATDQPVRILAHSMGGLVARAMFSEMPDVWRKFRARVGSRLVMLGTPNGGSFTIPRVVVGREKLVRQIALLDLRNSLTELLGVISKFDGLLQLLPVDNDDWDFAQPDTWKRLKNAADDEWVLPDDERLQTFRQFRKVIDSSPIDSDRMLYVAGSGRETPVDIRIESDSAGNASVRFIATDEGDGRVPWRSGPPKDVPVWYMDAQHGDLADHRDAFPALYELLQTGKTTGLSKAPPSVKRAADRFYELRDVRPEIYPSIDDLEDAALGRSTKEFAPAVEAEPVSVSVAHGNFCFCDHAIAVGHYEGDGLYSAERDLDHHLDGKLSHRHRLGLYPGTERTVEVLLNIGKKPAGAIIVGLGKLGELSPRKLSDSFTTALLQYAVKSVDAEKAHNANQSRFRLQLSTLLVGSGTGGIPMGDSIGAILDGVTRANQALAATAVGYSARFDAVQFVELYKDRAVQAIKELQGMLEKPGFSMKRTVDVIPGGRRRLEYSEPEGYWTRVNVRSRDDSLLFTALSKRARAEEMRLAVQRRNIDRFVEQAVNDTGRNRQLTAAMFELLIPLPLKDFAREQSNIVLVVDDKASRYPWELLCDRKLGVDKPLAVEVGVVRQLTTTSFRQHVVETMEDAVLVVGEPPAKEFVPLPGARREAELVVQRFRDSDFAANEDAITEEIGEATSALSIVTSLLAKDYRVLHLAGHGVYRYKRKEDETKPQDEEDRPKEVTGVVLGGGIFLTAAEIGQMRQVPELVFVNCCHLGKMGSEQEDSSRLPRNEFAASVAKEFIEMGVRAVVCAGWAVDDDAALTFADTFYDRMLRGDEFGDAVHTARRETFELHGKRTNTWGAYQCYGDPTYVLTKRDRGVEEVQFADADEVVLELDDLASDARTGSARDITELRERLDKLDRAVPSEWSNRATINEALGRAYGEVGLFEKAESYYTAALKSEKAFVSIRAAEQRANLRVRWATRMDDKRQARRLITTSVKEIESLNKMFSPTAERMSILGSAFKRLAQISAGKQRIDALSKMQSAYDTACMIKLGQYPFVNRLLAKIVKLWLAAPKGKQPRWDAALKDEVDQAQTLAHLERLAGNDFWSAIGVPDAKLAEQICVGEMDASAMEEIEKEYAEAWKRFGSKRELGSVIEHLEFLIQVLGGAPNRSRRAAVCESLRDLQRKLQRMVGD